ncbi:hemerythrin domain-containing protein [Croceicoccus marinus]|jgi:hemerythrin superfamily protein|uniref:Hemerythrin domain-containing protein n=1 Tax=Croceicoccus marinus TaxID=450378 RepID=A0A1Z1FGX6_9SPHN|nr:hemerythrin domain-containing protein [Croceicoccus marinus]ARU17983.1 hypothetical protein A9D14_16855 [Croceicoccus marinus]QNE07488.1 hemerythrin domain-containing protein [Croceicoccus marinus]
MSFLDKLAAAIAPAASKEDRAEARRKAEALAGREEWIGLIVQQHKQIETLISEAATAPGADARRKAVREFERVLTGHATAEEAVLYPDMAEFSGKTHAGMGYEEHAMTKIQVAKLEKLDPMSDEWREKIDHIRSALEQHMYQEEGSWMPDLAEKLPQIDRTRLTERFVEEYERYCGDGSARQGAMAGAVQR